MKFEEKKTGENNQNFTMLSELNWVAECSYIQRIKCSHAFKLFNGDKIIKMYSEVLIL